MRLDSLSFQNLREREENLLALDTFFNWLTALTKVKHRIHAFLVSSEQFFLEWVLKRIQTKDIYSLGDLNKTNADLYFATLGPPPELNFDGMFALTGKNIINLYHFFLRWKYGFHNEVC